MIRLKLKMAQRFVFLTVMLAALLGGCDRLSEKDKMEMIAICDTIARRQIKEEEKIEQTLVYVSRSVTLETHYSFGDSKCYALETSTLFIFGGDNPSKSTPSLIISETLYDGMTKEKLLRVGSATENLKNIGLVDEALGSLATKEMSRDQASKIIKAKMSNP